MSDEPELNIVELATDLTVAWLGNQSNRASADDVPAFLQSMHATLVELAANDGGAVGIAASPEYTPAVSVRKSLSSPDHIISMIDGKPYKALRRHLSTHGLSPEQYRERYGLKADYPMTAPSYSEARRAMAHKIGLGSKRRATRSGVKAAAADQKTSKAAGRARKAPARNTKPKADTQS